MATVKFPDYINTAITKLKAGIFTPNQAFARISFLVANVDELAFGDNIDFLLILMNPHINKLVLKLKEPLDVENMIKYNLNIQSHNLRLDTQTPANLYNVIMIENVIAFVLKEINPEWIVNTNAQTTIELFLHYTDIPEINMQFFQECIWMDEQ